MRRLERDAERGAWPAIIFHAALDLALAVFFLAALTAICANYLQNLELIPASDWRAIAFFRYAETDPWGAGFWLTAILLSTLVPTVIHLAAAVGALMVVPPPLRRLPLRYLDDVNPSTLERWMMAGYLTAWIFIAVGAAGATLYGIVYGLSYHGHTLWTLVFDLAGFLVFAGN
jgi:hypothetical protein